MKSSLKKLGKQFPAIKSFVNILRNHKNIPHQMAILKDYEQMRSANGFLRARNGATNGKKVLVVSLTQYLYQVKLEAILAKSLQMAGCEITVLTWRHCLWPKKYFQLYGIDSFIDFEDYMEMFQDKDVSNEMQPFLQNSKNFQSIKGWRFKDCRIGQQILSTLGRMKYGMPDLTDESTKKTFDELLSYTLRSVYAADILLKERHFDVLLFNEANGVNYGAFFDLGFRQKKELLQFVHALRDNALVFKRFNTESMGLHPNSVSRSSFDTLKALPWSEEHEQGLWREFEARYGGKWFLSQRNYMGTKQKDRAAIVEQLRLDKNKKNVVLFSHVLWDANLFYGEDIFQDYEEWFVETIKAACQNKNVNWIVKFHPANVWKRNREDVKGELRESVLIREQIGKLPPHVHVVYPDTDINAFSLFQIADYGITGRGTVGMELPCFGIPTLTAGTGRYSNLGFTIDSASREEYLQKIRSIQNIPTMTSEEILLAKKYAYAIFNLRPWNTNSFKMQFNYQKRGIHPLDHNYQLLLHSKEELAQAQDLQKFTEWALHSTAADYLEEWQSVCTV